MRELFLLSSVSFNFAFACLAQCRPVHTRSRCFAINLTENSRGFCHISGGVLKSVTGSLAGGGGGGGGGVTND